MTRAKAERNEIIRSRLIAGERAVDLAVEFGISRQRVEQIFRPKKHAARNYAKDISVPEMPCQECGAAPAEEKYHPDYTNPRLVVFVCTPCHGQLDAEQRKQEAAKVLRVPASDVATLSEASAAIGTGRETINDAIDRGELRAERHGGWAMLSLTELREWEPGMRERQRQERRSNECLNGHSLADWNRNASGSCRACASDRALAYNGGRATDRATRYEVCLALVQAGHEIDLSSSGNKIKTASGLTVSTGQNFPWRLTTRHSGKNTVLRFHDAEDLRSWLEKRGERAVA